jgi:hypothetical protein
MPKLAITVYHDFKDFWEIPQFLDRLGLGYRFYLRHFTIHEEERVLFGTPEGRVTLNHTQGLGVFRIVAEKSYWARIVRPVVVTD